MGVTAAQLTAKVSAEGISETKSGLADVGAAATSTGGIFRSALGGALSLASGVAGQALNFLKDQFVDSVKVAMDHQQVMAQTAQAIKSTGDASGESAQSIDDMADSLSRSTEFTHDSIQAGENLLLTFTGIGKDTFPQATSAMLDLSQAMGEDTKSAAVQLGKALNDPLTGLTALQRVGVTFSDSEKEQIKQMMAVGDTAGAQKVMLKELETEFGGSAEAAGKTLPGALAILKNNFDDVKEKIGTAVIPVLASMAEFVSGKALPVLENFGGWFSARLGPAIQFAGSLVGGFIEHIKEFAGSLDKISLENFTRNFGQLGTQVKFVFDIIGGIGKTVFAQLQDHLAGLKPSADQVSSVFGHLGNLFGDAAKYVHQFATFLSGVNFADIIQNVQQFIGTLSSQFGPIIQNIVHLLSGQFSVTLKDISKDAQQLGGFFTSSVVPAVQKVLPPFMDLAKTLLGTLVPAAIQVRGVVMDVVQHAFEKFAPIIERIVPPLIQFGGIMAGVVSNAIKFLTPYIISAAKEIGKFADGLIDRLAPIAINVFNIISTAVAGFSKFWSAIWPTVSAVLKGVWDGISGIIQIAWSIVSGIINIGLDILSGNWSQAWKDVQAMFQGIWDGIKTYLQGAWEVIKAIFSPVISFFSGLFQGAYNGIVGAMQGMAGFFQGLASGIQGAFSGIAGFFKGIGDGIWNGIKGGIDSVINGINSFIGFINGIHIDIPHVDIGPVHIGGGSIGLPHIPTIPLLAEGGLIGGAGFAIVGEQGPEGVFLPAGAQVVPNSQLNQMGQQPTIIVQPPPVYLDGRLLASGLMPYITNGIRYATGARI